MEKEEKYTRQKELMSKETFLEDFGINESRFYTHVKAGNLKITKDGRRTFIKHSDAMEWLHNLGKEE